MKNIRPIHKSRVKVDFAGTPEEVREYIKEHSGKFPNGLSAGRGGAEKTPNGDQMLLACFKNGPELTAIQRAFSDLGWPIEAQCL